MADNLYKGLLLAAAPTSVFFFGDTASNKTTDAVAGNIAQWSTSPTATVVGPDGSSDLDPLGLGYVDTTNGCAATISPGNGGRPGLPSVVSGFEVVMRMLQYPTLPVGSEDAIIYCMGSGSSGSLYLEMFNSSSLPKSIIIDTATSYIAVKNFDYLNNTIHVFCKKMTNNTVKLYVNGSMVASGSMSTSPSSGWTINGNGSFPMYKGQFLLSCIANFGRDVTDAEIAERAACVARTHKLAGIALLESGAAATRVLVRRASDHLHLGALTPDVVGAWSCYVPPGDYEVSALGPSGYRPVCDSPVTAVAA